MIWPLKWYDDAKSWTYVEFKPAQTPDGLERQPVPPNRFYVTCTLKSLRIAHRRVGWKTYYGVVHSQVKAAHWSGAPAHFQVVSTPKFLENLDGSKLDRVVQLDKTLAGPVPYRGGRFEMEVGVFAVKVADLAQPVLALLQSISAKAGVAVVNQAMPFVDLIAQGVSAVTGAKDAASLAIALAREYTPVRTGWYAVIGAEQGQLEPASLRINPGDYALADSTGMAVTAYPYLLFSITASTQRDDFFGLPEIAVPYAELRTVVARGDAGRAKELLTLLQRTVHTSPDLLPDDAKRLFGMIQKQVDDAFGREALMTSGATRGRKIDPLKKLPLYRDRTKGSS